MPASSVKPTIVLVHGAWHCAESFTVLRTTLHGRGWATEAPSHVTPGDTSGVANTGDNARVIRQVLQRLCDEGKVIIILAHSYGGCTASCAVEGLNFTKRASRGEPGGVIMFIYLSAFIIPTGVTLKDAFGGELLPWHRIVGYSVYPENPGEIFYHDLDVAVKEKYIKLLKPEPLRIFGDTVTYDPWHDLKCAYVFCENDQAIPLSIQRAMAARCMPLSVEEQQAGR
ncbi:Alpha/beta hydrolase fold-1 [Stachybotrys elegans]|uniref:Alpha/beta hydrolase fold-1 n=1 Tax=Stachybotrys elegans TaxID=80388 RepID=A0A8K0WJS2_9HYPO|nr:Alpha/beta hydrolase fold-1 [Stachybotrys elegans]